MEGVLGQGASARRGVTVNRLALMALAVAANLLGAAPSVLVLGQPRWVLYGAILVVIGAALGARAVKSRTLATFEPTWQEWLLAAVELVGIGAGIGIMILMWAGLGYAIVWLVRLIAGWVGWTGTAIPAARTAAHAVAAVIGGVYTPLAALAAPRMVALQLYPDAAGIRSAFHPLIESWRKWPERLRAHPVWVIGIVAGLGGVAACCYFVYVGFGWTAIYLALLLASSSAMSSLLGAVPFERRENGQEVRSTQRLLEAAGYHLVRPRTGDPASDPLLLELDLLAHNGQRAMAMAVRTGRVMKRPQTAAARREQAVQEPYDAAFVPKLELAAWACGSNRELLGLPTWEVEPWLVLVDMPATDAARELAARQGIRIVEMTRADTLRIAKASNATDLRQMAHDYLGLSTNGSVPVENREGGTP